MEVRELTPNELIVECATYHAMCLRRLVDLTDHTDIQEGLMVAIKELEELEEIDANDPHV